MELALFHLVAYVAVGVLSEALSDALSPQYCTILSPSLDIIKTDYFSSYGGEWKKFRDCEGLPAFGASFVEDDLTRIGKTQQSLLDSSACCLTITCGHYNDGYCTSKGNECNDGVAPYQADWCPGSYAQCCPNPEKLKAHTSTENDDHLFAQENLPSFDIIGGEEIGLGNLNLDEWTTTPLKSDNLFLASDNTDDYGLIAGLGDLTGSDFGSTV